MTAQGLTSLLLAELTSIGAGGLALKEIGLAVDRAALDALGTALGTLDAWPFGALDALPLNTLCTTLNTLAVDAGPFGALDALTLDPRPLGALDALAVDAGPLGALDTLALDAWPLGALDALARDAWALGTLAFCPLRPLRLALALARLGPLAAVATIALRIGGACQSQAGDAGDQEKLTAHD